MIDRYLAIDYGTKRIGVALTDPLKLTAQPLAFIANDQNAFAEIIKIVKTKNVSRIIIGNPINLNGQPGLASEAVKVFFDRLSGDLGEIKCLLWDERLTSAEANKRLIESGVRRENRKEFVDSYAAALLLENYLQATGGRNV